MKSPGVKLDVNRKLPFSTPITPDMRLKATYRYRLESRDVQNSA